MSYRKLPMFGKVGGSGASGADIFLRGIHKGKRCAVVVESDPGYFSWLLANADDVLPLDDFPRLTAILSAAAVREGVTLQKDYLSGLVWDFAPLLNHYVEKTAGSSKKTYRPKKEKAESHSTGSSGGSGSTGGNPWAAAEKWAIPADLQPYALEIIAAGRRALAAKNHPDAGGDNERMVAINRAADMLEMGTAGTLTAGGAR